MIVRMNGFERRVYKKPVEYDWYSAWMRTAENLYNDKVRKRGKRQCHILHTPNPVGVNTYQVTFGYGNTVITETCVELI